MQYYEMGGSYVANNKKIFNRKIFVTQEEIDEVKNRFNNKDVYCTAFKYDNENQDESNLIGPLYIDLDYEINNDIDFQKIKRDLNLVITTLENEFKVPRDLLKLYFSGNKGFHIIVSETILGVTPCKNLNEIYKAIAQVLKNNTFLKSVDTRIYDNKRLLRVVNTINSKTGLYKVPIKLNQLNKFSFEQMQEYAKQPKIVLFKQPVRVAKAVQAYNEFVDKFYKDKNKDKHKHTEVFGSIKEMPLCIKAIEDNGATKGQRNNTAIILANCYYQLGLTYEEALNRMLKWNDEKNMPNLSETEIISVTFSGYKAGEKNRKYGCSSIKDLDLCIKNTKCKFFNKK